MKNKFTLTITAIAIFGLLLTNFSRSVMAEATTNLTVSTPTGNYLNFNREQLLAMPKTTVYAELYCEGNLATYGDWSGVLLSYLLAQAQVTPEVASVQLAASDGYKVSIPIDLAIQPETVIAYEKDGQSLFEGLRLVVPGVNGAIWIALITSIIMSTSGVEYPQAVTAGAGKIADIAPTPTSADNGSTNQQQSTTQSQNVSLENSSKLQTTSPVNVTENNQPTSKPQHIKNESLSSQVIFLTVITTVSIIVLSAGYLTYKRKQTPLKT